MYHIQKFDVEKKEWETLFKVADIDSAEEYLDSVRRTDKQFSIIEQKPAPQTRIYNDKTKTVELV